MEKLRQAIRELEADAEKFERHVGAELIDALNEKDLREFVDGISVLRRSLSIEDAIASRAARIKAAASTKKKK